MAFVRRRSCRVRENRISFAGARTDRAATRLATHRACGRMQACRAWFPVSAGIAGRAGDGTRLRGSDAPGSVEPEAFTWFSAARQRFWRPGPDSNRRKRICSPLDRLSPTGPALPDDDIVRRSRTVNMALGRGVAPPIAGRPSGRGRPRFALLVRRQWGPRAVSLKNKKRNIWLPRCRDAVGIEPAPLEFANCLAACLHLKLRQATVCRHGIGLLRLCN